MDWLPYVLLAVFVILMVRRMLPVKGVKNLKPQELQELMKKPEGIQFIDVRESFEYKRGHIKGFRNVPLSVLKDHIAELDRQKSIVLMCQSGMRSRQAASVLVKHGYPNISHLQTGMSGWSGAVTK